MERFQLIVCFKNGTWIYDEIEMNTTEIDGDDDITENYLDSYKGKEEIVYIGVFSSENIEDEDEDEDEF